MFGLAGIKTIGSQNKDMSCVCFSRSLFFYHLHKDEGVSTSQSTKSIESTNPSLAEDIRWAEVD